MPRNGPYNADFRIVEDALNDLYFQIKMPPIVTFRFRLFLLLMRLAVRVGGFGGVEFMEPSE